MKIKINKKIIISTFNNSRSNESNRFLSWRLLIPNNFDKFLPHLLLLQEGRNNNNKQKVMIVPYKDFSGYKKGKILIRKEINNQPAI
tara:strand:+ start:1262 stop:1522 length:261 start_codon:yes stop_codon:yes gene_type:complete